MVLTFGDGMQLFYESEHRSQWAARHGGVIRNISDSGPDGAHEGGLGQFSRSELQGWQIKYLRERIEKVESDNGWKQKAIYPSFVLLARVLEAFGRSFVMWESKPEPIL
jgi:hypothetical protein